MSGPVDNLRERIIEARERNTPLYLVGGDSKRFLGHSPTAEPLSTLEHHGIVNYEPTELVITARAGTPLAEVEQTLHGRDQMLGFEPPSFSPDATLGGTIACGLSGPRRPYAGAARDFVLGTRIINGNGEVLRFGGEVMKNVAGYDVSRLMTGALGCLGVLLEVSLKVLPRPSYEITLARERPAEAARQQMVKLATGTTPLSGACHVDGVLYLRLAGTEAGVQAAVRRVGGEILETTNIWDQVRELTHPALDGDGTLWRLSVPAVAPLTDTFDAAVIDWGGALRWCRSTAGAEAIRSWATASGGHATAFNNRSQDVEPFQPLPSTLLALHRRLKHAFDPAGILNPGRLYTDL